MNLQIDKLKPETVIYGVLALALFFWATKKAAAAVQYVGEVSDKYNPLDGDNKINKALSIASGTGGGVDVLRYSNPILAAYDAAIVVAKKERDFILNLIK